MENTLNSIIESANSILILLPIKPYFDQVAAGLGLYLSLKEKKQTSISCSTPMLVEVNRLIGVNKITTELGDKNLTMKFVGYHANDIERVSYDIENGEFRLTVIPKPGLPSPKKEQVELTYSGVNADTIILIGGANDSHFPAINSKDLMGAKLVHIGTRMLNLSGDKAVISFARPASSVSELIATIISENAIPMDGDIATNLVMGIEEGSNRFANPEVTAATFEVFANLLKAGGQRISSQKESRREFSPQGNFPQPDFSAEQIEKKEETPKDWLEPKIFKGTSVS